ncbi:isopeptide-forming domain-containing fimbrial protein [Microbulbifer sp. ALW1]|uniref:isopeptide-forming domain-containing fimbrial protein n=1 Tax=Microbulbifer sp. (strain ALW1) TaxID=1516059 RepID=UPI00135B65A5|nr:isopeptide-forming domain-containing fimbrial protein [Microbulbifer sp. ALW1]
MELNEFSRSSLAQAINQQGRQLTSLRRVLEKRVLLDASVAADISHSASDTSGPEIAESADAKNGHDNSENNSDNNGGQDSTAEGFAPDAGQRQELVVIDLQLNDAQALIDDLVQQASEVTEENGILQLAIGERSVSLLTLDASDSLQTVTDFLADNGQTFDAIHLISHGGAGGIDVGGEELSLTSLAATDGGSHSTQLQSWESSLSADADILLYGCNTGYSLTGERFIDQIASLTGADVAASDDATGSALRGGDWELEQQKGEVETDIVFSKLLQGAWEGLMVATPGATVDAPSEDFINESTDIGISFENDGDTVGYGPFIDVVTGPGMTVDGTSGLNGANVETYTYENGQWVDSGGNPVLFHPFDFNQTGAIPLPPGEEGSTWYAIQLPFGSYSPDQPSFDFDVSVILDEAAGAMVGVPIPVWVRPGFAYGNDPLNNPDTDPPIVSNPIETTVTPTVIEVEKTAQDGDGDNNSIGDDGETVTGPSEPVVWRVNVDIANLSTVENLVVTEEVPNNFYYVPGNVVVTDSGGNPLNVTITEPPEGANNGSELIIEFNDPITGTLATNDIVITYTGYVPDVDANGDPIVINDGANDAIRNEVSVTGEYQDQTISDSDDAIITAVATALQKDVVLIDDVGGTGITPGDRLQYTLTLEVSDYIRLTDLLLTDSIQDGLEIDPDSFTFEIFTNGNTFGPDAIGSGNLSVTENGGDGSTDVSIDLSQELIDRGISPNGGLNGDLFQDTAIDGTTTVTITYEATIRETYLATGDAVNVYDVINNQATVNGSLGSANGQDVSNSGNESVQIEGADSSKSVYAIDGSTDPADLTDIAVGQTVTFAIDIDLATLDDAGLSITDYLPQPVFEAIAPVFFDTTEGANIPGVGEWGFGPATDFANWPDGYLDGANVTTSADSGNNSITWTLDPVEQLSSVGGHVQLLFTVQVLDQPFTDGLFLTNVASVTVNGTDETVTLPPGGIQIEVVSPDVNVTKGVISTDDGSGIFDPDPPGPVTFDPAGTPGDGSPPWTGTITSDDLDTTPIDSNLSDIDAGDTVRFAITLENTGGSDAFNLVISDTLPDGFVIPPGGLNLQVFTGDGNPIGFTGDLFTGGITLDDPSADEGALNEGRDPDTGTTTDGSNIIIITYDLIATDAVQPGQEIVNTAQLEAYGGVDGGNDYTEGNTDIDWQDDATVEVKQNTVDKALNSTSIVSPNNGDAEAVIGETAIYTLTIEIAEGITPSASILDTLDTGLQFVELISATSSSADIQNAAGDPWSQADLIVTPNGQQVDFDLGDLTNVNRDNTVTESITITYRVLVQNILSNQSSVQLNNRAQFSWDSTDDGIDNPTINDTDSAENITVIEPDLQIDKSLTGTSPRIDANDQVEYTVVISHTGFSDTDAFDATFIDTLPPELTNVVLASATLSINGSDVDVSGLFQVNGNTIEMVPGQSFDLPLGATLTLVIEANVINNIVVGTEITNTGTVDWESIDGDDPNERTGEDGPGGLNDYITDDSATFTVDEITAGKSVISTSIIDPYNERLEAVIGEEVTYEARFTVPEGEAPNAEIIDILPAGMEFVSFDGVFIGTDIQVLNGGFGTPSITDNPDGTTTLNFGTADLQNTGNDGLAIEDTIAVFYTVRVTNVVSNQAGVVLSNDAQFRWDIDGNGSNTDPGDGFQQDSADVTVIEPQLTIEKVADITTGDNGDQVTYTITVTNPDDGSSTTAYDVSFSDQLPVELENISFSANLVLGGSTPSDVTGFFTYDSATNQLLLDPQAELDIFPGSVVTITITGTLANTVTGSTITNATDVDWTSLDGADLEERTGEDGEGGLLNDYAAGDTADITVNRPAVDKVLVSTSQNDDLNDDTEATIGEIVTFSVTVTLPEATLTGQIIDDFGPGFEFIDLVSVTASNPDAIILDPDAITIIDDPANNTIGLDFGTLINTDTDNSTVETVTFTYRLRVTDIPTNVDGTTLNNEVLLQYDTDGDGTFDDSANSTASVDVVEPLLLIDKELLSPTPLTLGGLAQYQITVQLDPASGADAYNVVLQDALPPYIASVENIQIDVTGGSPTIIDNSIADLLLLDISEIDSTTVITITIDARVTSDPAAIGQTTTNTTVADYTSLDTPDGGDDSDIEREYEVSDEVTADIEAVDLFIDKDDGGIDVDNPAAPGDTITYTINYGNRGNLDATGVVITETLPDYVIYDPADNPGWVLNGDTLTFDVGDLAAGETGSVELIVTIINPLPSGVEETNNTVSIDGDESNGADPTPGDNTDVDVTPIEAAPDYVIDKVEEFDDPAFPGETISWSITIVNEGNQDGTGVVITDQLPSTPFVSGYTASDGGIVDIDAGTVVWNIGDLAVGESVTVTLTGIVADEVPPRIPLQVNAAEVTDDGTNGPDPTPENNVDSEPFDITEVDLSITKDDGGITTAPGGTVVYTLTYANLGTALADNVLITETLPPNTTFDAASSTAGWVDQGDGTFTFDLGTLDPGETGTVDFAVIVDDPLPAGVEEVLNSTEISYDDGRGPDQNLDNNSDDDNTPINAQPDYVIDKIENFDDPANPGDTIEWTIEVSNQGNQDGTGVVVTDNLPDTSLFNSFVASDGGVIDLDAGTVTWNIGDLAAGDSVSFTLSAVVNESVPTVIPTQTNTVTVDDDGTNGADPTPDNNTDSEDLDITYVDLAIDKDDGGVTVEPGDTLVYTLTYANNGTADATGVTITESLPEYATFDAANSTAGWIDNGDGTFTFNVGALAAGDSGNVEFAVIIDEPIPSGVEETSNTTSITDDGDSGPDQNTDDNDDDEVTPIDGRPDYVIDKIENFDDPANPGDTIEWTIEVSNQGNQDGTGVVVTDNLPDTSLFSDFIASDGGVIDLDAGTVTWNIGDLAAGDSVSFTLSAVVNESVPTVIPTQTNTVTVDDDGTNGADPTPDNNTDSEDLDITYVDLAIDKDDGGVTVEPGDTLVYTLTYANNGTADATGVTITESLPEYATFDAANSTAGWIDNGDGTFTFNVGALAAGDSGSVEFAVIIDEPIPSGVEETSNTTSITDDGDSGPDQNTDDNDDDEVTPIDGRPDYVIDKIENFDDPANPGDTIEWTIEVSNQGNQDGTGVVVTDNLPDTSLFSDFIASDGGVIDLDAGTVTWNIGDLAAGDSVSFTLTAVVAESVPTVIPTQTNTVTVDDDGTNGPDPTPDNNTDSEDLDITYVDLAIDKDDGGVTVEPGDTLVYTLTYANNGTADATGVTITESLPEYATFDAANSTAGWIDNGDGTFTFNVGALAAGDSGSVEFAVIIDEPIPSGVEETSNTTSITDDGDSGPDQNTDDNDDDEVTPIDGRPDYVIDKIENFDDPVNPGDAISWTIEVRNEGNQDGTGVVVTDLLPDTSLFNNFTASNGGVIDLDAGTVTWNIGDLAVGESVTLTLTAVVADTVPANVGPQTNTVVVDDDGSNGLDPTPDNNRDDETLVIEFVDLFVDKDHGDAEPGPTDTLVYTLSYGNAGTAEATGVVITETLPPNTSFDAANSSPGWVQNGDVFTFDVGTLAAGETGIITFAVTIDYPLDATVQQINNTAEITDDGNHGPDQEIDNNRDDDVTDLFNPGPNVDNITLSQLFPEYIYPPREWERQQPELHGRLISKETEDLRANLQGARNGGNFDPGFGSADGRFYPNDWSRVFSNDLSIDTSASAGMEKSSPLALDKDLGRYRANSLFGDFERPAASPELPAGATNSVPVTAPLPAPLQSSPFQSGPGADEPLNLIPERSQLQRQLDDIARELSEAQVSPLLAAFAALSVAETGDKPVK